MWLFGRGLHRCAYALPGVLDGSLFALVRALNSCVTGFHSLGWETGLCRNVDEGTLAAAKVQLLVLRSGPGYDFV
jgi:hypothetical protein